MNERLETNMLGIYVQCDGKGGPNFTHVSCDDYRIVRENLLHGGDETAGDRVLTHTVLIDPHLGGVGMTERMARAQDEIFV